MPADSDLNFFSLIDADPDGERMTTTSLRVASVHGKRHDSLMRLIRSRIAEAGEWGVRNFVETPYVAANGETYPMYVMTKDGYMLLVGRLSGKLAIAHQIAFIEAFNAMAAMLRQKREGLEYRRAKFEQVNADSERRGSIHGRGLNLRKLEIPGPEAERQALLVLSQPQLPGMLVVVLQREAEAEDSSVAAAAATAAAIATAKGGCS
jgi:Rha family phage regulatory protein